MESMRVLKNASGCLAVSGSREGKHRKDLGSGGRWDPSGSSPESQKRMQNSRLEIGQKLRGIHRIPDFHQ